MLGFDLRKPEIRDAGYQETRELTGCISRKSKAPRKGPKCGANYRIRTCDLLITNQLLYQLS